MTQIEKKIKECGIIQKTKIYCLRSVWRLKPKYDCLAWVKI